METAASEGGSGPNRRESDETANVFDEEPRSQGKKKDLFYL